MTRSVLLAVCLCALAGRLKAAEAVDYLRDVKPILKGHCYACHGALKQKAKLRLDTARGARRGGRHGPAVVAGRPDTSPLLRRVSSTRAGERMPPEGPPLTAKQVAVLKAWVGQGAGGPAGEKPDEDPRRHWAFRRPARPDVSRTNPGWCRNPVDSFLASGHARHGLNPNPPAGKATLLRRVYLDLVGLPPTRAQLHAFLEDRSPDAYEKVVERLLASPQYGERWGRHWLDVWRYSDWYGRRAVPDVWNSAPQVWRWRDWVVDSLNADKGYDRMVREMLAADEVAPGDDEAAVATGYLVRNWYALNPNQWMRDVVEHTGKAFLGLTFNCAHCHDHKYDPISQEEYFRFRAFFEPIQVRQDRVAGEPDPGPFQKYEYVVLRKVVRFGRVAVFDERLDAKTYVYRMGDERDRVPGRPPVAAGAPAFLGGARLKVEPVELPVEAWYAGIKPWVQRAEVGRREQALAAARAARAKARQALEAAKARLADAEGQVRAGRPLPPVVAEAKARAGSALDEAKAGLELAEARVATDEADLKAARAKVEADNARYRKGPGNPDELAKAASKAERHAALCVAREAVLRAEQSLAAAKRKAPALVKQAEQRVASARAALESARKALAGESPKYTPLSPVYPPRSSGRRRALAEWITGRDNPLTARVAVNHVWKWHFGKPLVETVSDFGRNGKAPTHPELLDWLAVELMDNGWSLKHLHRLIVTSSAYRMGSAVGENRASYGSDPDNTWLWRFAPRRVEAEVVRDSLLYAAGGLETHLGGPPVENNVADTASRRRSLYFSVYPEDGGHPKLLELFDAPDPCDCYRRTQSIIPQQALALSNGRLSVEQGRVLARKLWGEVVRAGGDEGEFVVAAFEQVLSRPPTPRERAACLAFLTKQADVFRRAPPAALRVSAGAVAPSAEPAMRAREGLVRVLFNHDEFVSVK
jgi:hypothetical protein